MASNPLLKGLPPTHPGELLRATLDALDQPVQKFAEHIGVTRKAVYDVLRGDASVSARMALRLEKATGVRAQMWLNLQRDYDLRTAEAELAQDLAKISRLKSPPAAAAG